MASVNKVTLIGNLGRDPEVRYMPSGDAMATLNVATTEAWKDKNGNKQEQTEWHRVVFFGRLAEVCSEYLKKGSQVYVEGSLKTRKYNDKEGNERYTTEIRGNELKMLGGRNNAANDNAGASTAREYANQSGGNMSPQQASGGSATTFSPIDEDDIPFAKNDAIDDPMGRKLARRLGRYW